MAEIRWQRYLRAAEVDAARAWLVLQANLGLAANTINAYGLALEEYLAFSAARDTHVVAATRDHVAAYVRDLTSRPNPRGRNVVVIDSGVGLANATLQQRLTAIRLFYDYLMEEGLRSTNPVGRGRYTPGKGFGGARERGLIPRFTKLPWIPNDEQWRAVLDVARKESFRNRAMLALSYDCALRREELCGLEISDIDPAHRTITIRAETTKNRRARVVPYSTATAELVAAYLKRRRELSRERGRLFISESRRNAGKPISIWTWSKVVEGISEGSGIAEFTTHTTRHLCLTGLARANWDVHEIAAFAGHRSVQTTLLYIHLSGRELAAKLAKGMAEIHAWRTQAMKDTFLA
ncbi:MAG: tyrosine-type recombinase/integrase [Acidobacteria bacterium]|nr:tyrosine-type recombinase/integrase [Acidobacteriota bacterium]